MTDSTSTESGSALAATAEVRTAAQRGLRPGEKRRRPGAGRRLPGRVAGAVIFALAVLGLWQWLGSRNPLFASYPTAIAKSLYTSVATGTIWPALGDSLRGWGLGFLIAVLAGTVIGYVVGASRVTEIALVPYINALNATPRIALIPILVLWFGIGFELRVVIVVLSAIFPIIMNIHDGTRAVPPQFIDVARSFVASRFQAWRTVVFPCSLPYLFVGYRHGISRAITGILVAEMIASITGVGREIVEGSHLLQTDRVMAFVLVVGAINIGLTVLLGVAERRFARWSIPAEEDRR